MQKRARFAAGLLAGLLAITPLHADRLPELGDSASDELSLANEKRIGQDIMHQIRSREPTYLDDPEIEDYLNQLGGRVASASSDPAIGFYFFGVEDSSINAFALPGGYIGVHSGLILAAQSESELAGVLAHEVAHVTQRHIARQLQREKQMSMPTLLMLAAAMIAAHRSPQASQAAVVTSEGISAQVQMAFSRDYEREADRAGFETMQKSGFDARGMSTFFQRLDRVSRLHENEATAFLRTHPVTRERIADMENREHKHPYKQVPDSAEFHVVRAKLRASRGHPSEAAQDFRDLVTSRKFASPAAAHYGLAYALYRSRDWAGAEREIAAAKRLRLASPMVERLLADCRIAQGDVTGGMAIYRDAIARYALSTALMYAYARALVEQGRYDDSLAFVEAQLRTRPGDVRLHRLQAQAYAALGRRAQQHRWLAEAYAVEGATAAAVEQMGLAQRAGDANFYESSVIDARMRELKRRLADENRQKRTW